MMQTVFNSDEVNVILHVKQQIQKHTEAAFEKIASAPLASHLEIWIKENFVVSGGISASVFTGTEVKDIDLYYKKSDKTPEEIDAFIRAALVDEGAIFKPFVKSIDPKYMVGEVNGKLITANAVTLYNDMQIIRLGNIDECRKVFDFKHCLPTYNFQTHVYKISRNEYDSLSTKTLMTHNTPLKDHRIVKFKSRGWDFKTVNSP